MSHQPETPFDSLEGAHEYVGLLLETIAEARKELAADTAAAADLPVSGIVDVPAHVSGFDVTHARQTLKDRFNAPETSAAKNCCLLFCHDR